MVDFRYYVRLRGPGLSSGSVAILSKYRSFAFLGRGPLARPRNAKINHHNL